MLITEKAAVKLMCLHTKKTQEWHLFPVLQKSSLCLCHFKKEVCAASLKAHLQPALSVQNVKSHQDRPIEKREAENLE